MLWWVGPGLDTVRRVTLTVAVALGAVAGILLGPYGTDAVAFTDAVRQACQDLITEWFGMLSPQMAARWGVMGLLAIVGALRLARLVRAAVARRPGRRTRLGLMAALTTAGPAGVRGGFTAVRFIGVAAFALVPAAALGMTAAAGPRRPSRRRARAPRCVPQRPGAVLVARAPLAARSC